MNANFRRSGRDGIINNVGNGGFDGIPDVAQGFNKSRRIRFGWLLRNGDRGIRPESQFSIDDRRGNNFHLYASTPSEERAVDYPD